MNPSDFVRVEKREGNASRFFVVHGHDPKFSLEFKPEAGPDGKPAKGIIKRLVLPNSWTGDYHRYGKLLGAAEAYLEASLSLPESPPRHWK